MTQDAQSKSQPLCYSPIEGEEIAAYKARLDQIAAHRHDRFVLRAARILQRGIESGVYGESNPDNALSNALSTIYMGLLRYDETMALSQAPEEILEFAAAEVRKGIEGRLNSAYFGVNGKIPQDVKATIQSFLGNSRKTIQASTQSEARSTILEPLDAAWKEIKIGEGFKEDENVSVAQIANRFKPENRADGDTIYQMVRDIGNLRKELRDQQKGNRRP